MMYLHITAPRLSGEGFSVFVKVTELISYLKIIICGANTRVRLKTLVIHTVNYLNSIGKVKTIATALPLYFAG